MVYIFYVLFIFDKTLCKCHLLIGNCKIFSFITINDNYIIIIVQQNFN